MSSRRMFTFAGLGATLLLVLTIWFAGRILLMAFGGFLIAVLFYSLAEWLSSYTPLSYGWALAVVVILIVIVVGLLFWLVGSTLATQAGELLQALPQALKQIQEQLEQNTWGHWILDRSPDWGRSIAQGNLPIRITDMASSILDNLVAMGIIFFVGLYGAAEPALYTQGLLRLVPIRRRERARKIFTALVFNVRWWLLGQIFAMICVGVISGLGIWLVGAPTALALAVLAALLEAIPNIGPVLWLIPAALVTVPQGPWQVLNVVGVYAITHGIESYVIIPLVQRRVVLLPPALSILVVVLLGVLAGFLGFLVAAPLALVAMLLVKMLYVEDRLGDYDIEVAGEPKG